jgi:signal transduction histidine kinase
MKVSLKVKLTGLISVLVLFVVLAISALYVFSFVRETLREVEKRDQAFLDSTSSLVQAVPRQMRLPAGTNREDIDTIGSLVRARLREDPSLRSEMQTAVAFAPSIAYIAVTDPQGIILVHEPDPDQTGDIREPNPYQTGDGHEPNPYQTGDRLADAPPLQQLLDAWLFRQLLVVYGPPKAFEIRESLSMSGRPICTVVVSTSTVFLAAQITPQVRKALELAAWVVLFAPFLAALLSFRVLRPLETISSEVDRMARGELTQLVKLKRTDEWGALSSKLNLLGEQIRGEKAAFVALKGNLDQLFSNLADGLLLFDSQDRLALATPAVSRFLGRPTEELLHGSADKLFSDSGPLERRLREAFRGRESVPWQTVELPAESGTRRVSISLQFVREEERNVVTLVTLRDASTRAELQDQLDVAAKLAALGRLTSGVAHEVKNPLNAMVLQLEILKAKLGSQGEEVNPQLQILFNEIRRLDRVVKTFLDFARPVELHPTATDLETLVREVFTLAEPHARTNRVELILEPNGALPPVRLDPDLMKQALLNLVLNGCQAMPSGGQLKVAPHLLPRAVELEIADQGVGIPPEARPKIFSLYFTTKQNGTGVGLAMAYRIIQLHNGSIEFSSEVDRGTTFRVSLPL